MTSAYASVQQWHHANAVHLACKADLFDQRPSLVVVRSNVVEVYAVVDDRPLRLRHRLVLQGTPVDVKPARFPGSQRDSLLLTFMDALLSRLDFNPETNRFETTAMHAYEMPKRKLGGVNDFQPPLLCVDPQQRCSAYVVASDSIMIWPFTDRVEFGAVHVTSDAPKGWVARNAVVRPRSSVRLIRGPCSHTGSSRSMASRRARASSSTCPSTASTASRRSRS